MRSDEEEENLGEESTRQSSFQNSLKKMEKIVAGLTPDHPSVQFSRASILSQSPRLKDKAEAQVIFQNLLNQKDIGFYFTTLIIPSLCQILLEEFMAFGEPLVLKEVNLLLDDLKRLAFDHQSWHLNVYTLILQAKLSMVDGDLTSTLQLLDEAQAIAEEKKSDYILDKVIKERKHVEGQYEKWQRLIQTNASYKERLEETQVLEYLKEAQKIVDKDYNIEKRIE